MQTSRLSICPAQGPMPSFNTSVGAASCAAPAIPKAGRYEIRLAYTPNGNRATNAKVTIEVAGHATQVAVNQRRTPPIDKAFVSLGQFDLPAGKSCRVTISNAGADGHVIVDAIQLLPLEQ